MAHGATIIQCPCEDHYPWSVLIGVSPSRVNRPLFTIFDDPLLRAELDDVLDIVRRDAARLRIEGATTESRLSTACGRRPSDERRRRPRFTARPSG
jgi:hypothetical protein